MFRGNLSHDHCNRSDTWLSIVILELHLFPSGTRTHTRASTHVLTVMLFVVVVVVYFF